MYDCIRSTYDHIWTAHDYIEITYDHMWTMLTSICDVRLLPRSIIHISKAKLLMSTKVQDVSPNLDARTRLPTYDAIW